MNILGFGETKINMIPKVESSDVKKQQSCSKNNQF
jgi:hypothetical protein